MGIATRIKDFGMSALLGRRYLSRGPGGGRAIAVTFDDGPIPVHTPAILDLLKAHGARGTFFVTGDHAKEQTGLLRRIVDEGHELGNHSFHHVAFASLPLKRQIDEIERMDRFLEGFDGRSWHWFRPPQGRLPAGLVLALLRRRQHVAMWSLDSFDYRGDGAETILVRIRDRPVGPGEIVLFHDDNADTVEALAKLLGQWRAEGWRFATVSELAGAAPAKVDGQ